MRHLTVLVPLLLSSATLVSGCGGGDSTPTEPGGDTPTLQCVAPALAATSAEPFDRVAVTGIAGIGEDAWVVYEASSGATGLTPVFVDSTGRAEIVVPPNPDDLLGGGPLLLTVTNAGGGCEPLAIDVLPLPAPAGTELQDAASALDDLTSVLATRFGVDPAQAAATSLGDLPPQAVGVALLLEAQAAFDASAVLADLDSTQAVFLQAALAKFDVAAVFADLAASLEAVPVAAAGASGGAVTADKVCGDIGAVPRDQFDLGTPEKLAEHMNSARNASATIGPLSQALGDLSTAFTVVGVAFPVAGGAGTAFGWLAFGANLIQNMVANLYPSSITRLEYRLDRDRIEEDWDPERGDPEIRWSFAKVWASNNGMSLARVGADLIMTGGGLPTGITGQAVEQGITALDFIGKNELNHRLDELENDPAGNADCWGIGATEFGPVVIDDDTGERWVTAEVITGDAVSVDGADVRKLKPERIGTATLRVRTQADAFPGPFGYEDKGLEVVRKNPVWIPQTLLVEHPGEPVTVKFRIDDALHDGPEDVQVTPGPNLPSLPEPTYADGVHTLTFTSPSERDKYPTWIDVCSTSGELPPDAPERCARIEIYADERVEITSNPVCVGNGETETITAVASGPGEVIVHWEIESGAGDLSSTTGLAVDYTAPGSGSGAVTLRAWLDGNPAIEDRITFRYGVCGGLALYYGNLAEISFPFGPGGSCSNPDLDAGYEELTFPEEGALPLVPPPLEAVWVGRSETLQHRVQDGGNFGAIPSGSQTCDYGTFTADAGYAGTFTGSADGTRLDIDIATDAASNSMVMAGDLGSRSSTAAATMSIGVRFDFDVTAAATYRLQLELAADQPSIPGMPPLSGQVNVIILQVEPDGTTLMPNATTAPIQVQCGPGSPVAIDRIMEFPAPSTAGQTDHVMVLLTTNNTSFGALPTDSGDVRHTGFLRGFISVSPN